MPKLSDVDRAIAKLQGQIDVRLLAIEQLKEVKRPKPVVKRATKAKKEAVRADLA